MNRLERITALLLLLQSRKKMTSAELAKYFQTSTRTIYRDIRILEQAGVPIGAEAGVGYFIVEGYNMPPVMFKKEEAAALLTAEMLVSKIGDVSIHSEFKTAMQKIRAVLRETEKDFLESLETTMLIRSYKKQTKIGFPNAFVSDIQKALVNETLLEIEYYSNYSDNLNKRVIEPIGLCYIRSAWHLIAFCRLRNAIRDFRADRIKILKVLDEKYTRSKHKSLQECLKEMDDATPLTEIIIRFDKSIIPNTVYLKHHYGLMKELPFASYTEMTFLYYDLHQFALWLLTWGNKATVVSPQNLHAMLASLAHDLHQHYQSVPLSSKPC